MSVLRRSKAIAVYQLGSQTTHRIASQLRQTGAYADVVPAKTPATEVADCAGIILSGSHRSVYEAGSPTVDPKLFDLGVPVLGICYGAQFMAQMYGGEVQPAKLGEFGPINLTVTTESQAHLLRSRGFTRKVVMSHRDAVVRIPEGYVQIAKTDNCEFAAFASLDGRRIGLQFHPEVSHTEYGSEILKHFAALCRAPHWSVENQVGEILQSIRDKVGNRRVFMLVSGGVDSTVALLLLIRALGAKAVQACIIDTGLMKEGESSTAVDNLARLGVTNVEVVHAEEFFINRLRGLYDPQQKRKAFGYAILEIKAETALRLGHDDEESVLGQGSIYPDKIESGGQRVEIGSDHSAAKDSDEAETIKTHHNCVEALKELERQGRLIEPVADFYKDEVRRLGLELGVPQEILGMHPSPGPAYSVRILCSDHSTVIRGRQVSSCPIPNVVLPVRSVGVQGDGRSYHAAVALFSPECRQGIIPTQFWDLASSIPSTERDINRVVACLSADRPSTFVVTRGDVSRERVALLRRADHLVETIIRQAGLYNAIWQFPVVLLPIGHRSGGQSIVLRPVTSHDAMTAEVFRLPPQVVREIVNGSLSIEGIDAVYYDLTSKPPGTIEWE